MAPCRSRGRRGAESPAVNLPSASLDPIDTQRLQLVADTVPALLAYLDEGVRYVWVNETYRRWFDRSPESIRGRHAREIVGEAAWAVVRHHVERALTGEEVSYEARVDFGPGHTRDVRVAYVPDRDASGRVRGFVSLVTDISDMQSAERALRESERMLAESQAAAHVGSWEAILTRRWVSGARCAGPTRPTGSSATSPAASRSTLASSSRRFIPTIARSCGASRSAVLGPDGRHETEYRIVRPDGAVRTIHAWTTVERDAAGRATRLRGTCQDITERKLAETEMRLAREQPPGRRRRDARPDRPLRLRPPSRLGQQELRRPLRQAARGPRGKAPAARLSVRRPSPSSNRARPASWQVKRSISRSRSLTRRWAPAGCTSSSRPPSTPGEPWTAASRSSPTTRISGSSNASAPARSRS